MVVRKEDSTVRLCGEDKVTINPYLDTDSYPMPNPQDLFAILAEGNRLTRLDLKQAYQ